MIDCKFITVTLTAGYISNLKYIVVAGAKSNSKEICAVLINSDSDYFLAKDWPAEQYLIRKVDYPGILDYDGWIDCTENSPWVSSF